MSNHPSQHKYAAVRFLYNSLHTYNLWPEEYQQEENTIHNILYNNSFPIQLHKPQKQQQTTHTKVQKCATFTYIGKETTYITIRHCIVGESGSSRTGLQRIIQSANY
jgi:hypothetical protein